MLRKNKLKIRFIKEVKYYHIQRKSLFGWKNIKYAVGTVAGTFYTEYHSKSKKKLLKKVLDEQYNTSLKRINITECPTIYKY